MLGMVKIESMNSLLWVGKSPTLSNGVYFPLLLCIAIAIPKNIPDGQFQISSYHNRS